MPPSPPARPLPQAGGSAKGRKAIAEASGIYEGKILDWVNRCDLMRIKGVGPEFSELLEAAGVDTAKELATRRAGNLHTKLVEANTAKKLVRGIPTLAEVESWINEARTLPGAVSY